MNTLSPQSEGFGLLRIVIVSYCLILPLTLNQFPNPNTDLTLMNTNNCYFWKPRLLEITTISTTKISEKFNFCFLLTDDKWLDRPSLLKFTSIVFRSYLTSKYFYFLVMITLYWSWRFRPSQRGVRWRLTIRIRLVPEHYFHTIFTSITWCIKFA